MLMDDSLVVPLPIFRLALLFLVQVVAAREAAVAEERGR
jgi:hypothetical protein